MTRHTRDLNTGNFASSIVPMHLISRLRYIMSMAVADWSGQAWLQGFNDAGVVVFDNKTANELMEIKVCIILVNRIYWLTALGKEQSESDYNALMAQATGKTFNFSCRAKQDTYNVRRSAFSWFRDSFFTRTKLV